MKGPFVALKAPTLPPCDWGDDRPGANARAGAVYVGDRGPAPTLWLCDRCAGRYDLAAAMLAARIISSDDIRAFFSADKTPQLRKDNA